VIILAKFPQEKETTSYQWTRSMTMTGRIGLNSIYTLKHILA